MEWLDKIVDHALQAKNEFSMNRISNSEYHLTLMIHLIQKIKINGLLNSDGFSSDISKADEEESEDESVLDVEDLKDQHMQDLFLEEEAQAEELEEMRILERQQQFQAQPIYKQPTQFTHFLYSFLCELLETHNPNVYATRSKNNIYKFKINPFLTDFLYFVSRYIEIEDQKGWIDLCYESTIIKRYNENNKKYKTKGMDVWVVSAKKVDMWIIEEFEAIILDPPFCSTQRDYEWEVRVWDPHSGISV
jgi:hypothetical protein